jgi:hypothetical protein
VCCSLPPLSRFPAPSATLLRLPPPPPAQSQSQQAVKSVGLDTSASQVTAGSLSYYATLVWQTTLAAVEDILAQAIPRGTRRSPAARLVDPPRLLVPGPEDPRESHARLVVFPCRQSLGYALPLHGVLFCAWLGASLRDSAAPHRYHHPSISAWRAFRNRTFARQVSSLEPPAITSPPWTRGTRRS